LVLGGAVREREKRLLGLTRTCSGKVSSFGYGEGFGGDRGMRKMLSWWKETYFWHVRG